MKLMRMNNFLIVVVGAVTLIASVSIPNSVLAAGSAVVSVSAPAQVVNSGTQFTVNITVQPNNAIAGVQFSLSFNPALVTVNSINEGNLLNQSGASTYFIPGTINNIAGTLTGVACAITTPGQTVANSGTLAAIIFTAGTTKGTGTFTLTNVVVGDINGHSVSVNVVNGQVSIDHPPALTTIGSKTVNEGSLLSFTVSASDPDGDTLTYSTSNLPTGASFNASTRTFSWTPTHNQIGTYTNVHFEVTDGSLVAFENITITAAAVYTAWDVNMDGAVNVLDLILITQHFSETGTTGWIRQDVNGDGMINVLDCIIVGQHWTG
jgi:hypothetical protein